MKISIFLSGLIVVVMAQTAAALNSSMLEPITVNGEVVGEKYIVQKGDTLWDITNQFYRDSYSWPKLWRENIFIDNPNKIYPGDVIIVNLTKGVQTLLPASPVSQLPTAKITRKQYERVEKSSINIAHFNITGFVQSKTRLQTIATLHSSVDGRQLIGAHDRVYLSPERLKTGEHLKIGDRLVLYRIDKKIIHPVTMKPFGELVKLLGVVEVDGKNNKFYTAQIIKSYAPIKPGDRLATESELEYNVSTPVTLSATVDKDKKGVIIATDDNREGIAEYDIVYLDIGTDNGVLTGENYNILKNAKLTGDKLVSHEIPVEGRIIGKLKIIATQKESSVGKITSSQDMAFKGDFVSAETK